MSFCLCRTKIRTRAAQFGFLFFCVTMATGWISAPAAAETFPAPVAVAGDAVADALLPSKYGAVIYQKDAANPRHIYIIGQSHRSGSTGRNGDDTVQVQSEIYRIGEHLIRQNGIELLLPEGYFQRGAGSLQASATATRERIGLDNHTLLSLLSAEDRFVNADMLLNDSYNIRLAQVEDEKIYRDVRRLLRQGLEEDRLSLLARLDHVQEMRSAAMLQNAGRVVEQAYIDGAISSPRAIFTIGLAHVDEIIAFFEQGRILPGDGQENGERLELLEQGYGVTVIIPRSLAENEEALRMARLDLD